MIVMVAQMTEASQNFEMLLLPSKQVNSSESCEEILRIFEDFPIDKTLLKNQLNTLLSTHSE